jgi:hypothetical protein
VSKRRPPPAPRTKADALARVAQLARQVRRLERQNVRLFTELQARNRDLAEALTRQTATSEILRVIAGSPTDLQPVLDALVESVARLCEAADTFLVLVEGDQLKVVAVHGTALATTDDWQKTAPELAQRSEATGQARLAGPIHRGWVSGRAVIDARTVHVEDLAAAAAEAEFPLGHAIARRYGHRTALAMPLLREGVPIGALFLRRHEVRLFSDKEMALLRTFADQAVIAIENVRLFKELQARNRDLIESLDRQTATGKILRVISSSPTDVQPVFDTIVESAASLCNAVFSALGSFDGELMDFVAAHNWTPAAWRRCSPRSSRAPSSSRASTAAWCSSTTRPTRRSCSARRPAPRCGPGARSARGRAWWGGHARARPRAGHRRGRRLRGAAARGPHRVRRPGAPCRADHPRGPAPWRPRREP